MAVSGLPPSAPTIVHGPQLKYCLANVYFGLPLPTLSDICFHAVSWISWWMLAIMCQGLALGDVESVRWVNVLGSHTLRDNESKKKKWQILKF